MGGVFAALAVVIMNLGGLIPMATYVCPTLCMVILSFVHMACGNRIAWTCYAAVSILSLLMSPDKEAAAIFLALGFYPIVKPGLDRRKGKWLLKGLFFNGMILLTYWVLLHLFGMAQLAAEFKAMGVAMTVFTLILGNITFFMVDHLLGKKPKKRKSVREGL